MLLMEFLKKSSFPPFLNVSSSKYLEPAVQILSFKKEVSEDIKKFLLLMCCLVIQWCLPLLQPYGL